MRVLQESRSIVWKISIFSSYWFNYRNGVKVIALLILFVFGKELNNQSRKVKNMVIFNLFFKVIICGDKAPDGEMKSRGSGLLVRCRNDHSTNFDGCRMVIFKLFSEKNTFKGINSNKGAFQSLWRFS